MIRRRYRRGLANFFSIYRPLADRWLVFDSSAAGPPRPVAAGRRASEDVIGDVRIWKEIVDAAGKQG